jgi:tetratricopeptide (TPR) repeat protein/DNA-binding XRE family transcriptional regulator
MATPHPPSFGALLRRHRNAAGLTQEELAAQASMSAHGIADLEAGRRRTPRKETVALLADALRLAGQDRAIFEAAARQRPIAAPTGVAEGSGVTPGVRLVGREAEMALIERHLAGIGPPLLVFAGEPGIGKSRLMREAAIRARALGWEVLWGGCHRRSGQEPFTPLLTALERHLGQQPPAQQRQRLQGCGWLVRFLPELAETGAIPTSLAPLPPEQERRLMFAAVRRYLANSAGPAGTLLVLDDLQWAATDALDLLLAVLRASSPVALRILAAYRDTEVRKHDPVAVLIADLAREDFAQRVALTSLSMADAHVLLEELLPNHSAEHDVLQQEMVVRSGGVPYFLLSCAQALTSGVLGGRDAASGVPWNVAETIRQRVGALPVEAQRLLSVAAVAGREVPRTVLMIVGTAGGQGETEVLLAMDQACTARLMQEQDEQHYRFAHDLVREAIVADLTAAQRAVLHRQVAEAWEHMPGAKPIERLAYHYRQAGQAEQAAVYLRRAAERARSLYANGEAAEHYRQLVTQLEILGRAHEQVSVQTDLGETLLIMARYDEALAVLEAAMETCKEHHEMDGLVRATAQFGRVHVQRGSPLEGLHHLRAFLRSLDDPTPSAGLAFLYTAVAELCDVTNRHEEEWDAADQAVALARAVGDATLLTRAEVRRGVALALLGRWAEGMALLDLAVAAARAGGDWWSVGYADAQVLTAQLGRGDFASTAMLDEATGLAEQSGDTGAVVWMSYWRGTFHFFRGEWPQACEQFERGIAVAVAEQVPYVGGYPRVGFARLLLAQGKVDEAQRHLDLALPLLEQAHALRTIRPAQYALAEWELLSGTPEAARARLSDFASRFPDRLDYAPLAPLLAWAWLDLGDLAAAEVWLDRAAHLVEQQEHTLAAIDMWRVRAMWYAAREEWRAAETAVAQSLALARAIPYPYAEAKALAISGRLSAQCGATQATYEQGTAALTILNRLGERLYAATIERMLANDVVG